MFQKFRYNFLIGIEALIQNRLRALLTSLGIIFGVASVIAMLSIGKGAQKEILAQMELLGANNIIINPIIEQKEGMLGEEGDEEGEEGEGSAMFAAMKKRYTPGLTMLDAMSLANIPEVETVSPEVVLETVAVRSGFRRSTKLVGIDDIYFSSENLRLATGNLFNENQHKYALPVCIIGSAVKTRFFPTEEALGKRIKCGSLWLTVIGILEPRYVSSESQKEFRNLGIRNFDYDIYVPLRTSLMRYENRSMLTIKDVQMANRRYGREEKGAAVNYHQVDKVVLRVSDSRYIRKVAEIANRMLTRRHNDVVDFEISIPEELLQQKQQTTQIFNFVLGAIASISLIVGGIGIMNIMLASVLERIKEIGLRLAVGATEKDIVLQFMSEAIAISVTGGVLGILLGVGFSYAIRELADIEAIVSPGSIVISFLVALTIGLVFGIYPAQKAAEQDPVVSLRSN
ncbi:MAG: ABC transporter permease [Bacteroidota bacterium]